LFAKLSIWGCTKADGKQNRTAQGNDGCGNQSVTKNPHLLSLWRMPVGGMLFCPWLIRSWRDPLCRR